MDFFITGGTGSLGQHFTEWAIEHGHGVAIFSRNESKQVEMKRRFPDARYIIGDVRDREAIASALRDYCDSTVIHAAALKHVSTGENQPWETIRTNIEGTKNVLDSAWGRVVLVSTDKAVEPVNLYGATKMAAERLTIAAGQRIVRYGNVFGSSGSVLHIFDSQRKNGHKFTITDHRMTRFVITFEQAIDAIMKAIAADPGSITIPELPAIRIPDLALAFDDQAEFDEIGIQPGEKLSEKLADGVTSDIARRLTVPEIRGLIAEALPERHYEESVRNR